MSERGKVKFYNSKKGFGFIEREGKDDVHFRRDSFKGKAPSEGDDVEFDVVKQTRGPHAKNLKITQRPFYMLPSDTRKIITSENIDNFALRLNKSPFFDSDEKFKFFKVDRKKGIVLNVLPDYSKLDIGAIAERHKNSIGELNISRKSIILKPEWRMVIGLGNESVYETSMTLHHIYGIPYIPGSAIKGVIRSHLITEYFEKNENGQIDLKNAEERALKDQGFCDIFGCSKNSFYNESRQGRVTFFDAFPLSEPQVKADVMNPHYGPYYSDSLNKPPADYHNPKPIFFITVENTEFKFIVGIYENYDIVIQEGLFEGKHPLEVTYEYIKKALSEHGIGAKTAVGYGYMNNDGIK
ncbi:MAG: type III-B CRISPR module RAMP protein Cmr6 [Candidatus Methanofastidiosa archaeon]|nr:type III-B CRISPR module RAMP protein Cmr6 [Candidatus Methanofastidiosa archaeon]